MFNEQYLIEKVSCGGACISDGRDLIAVGRDTSDELGSSRVGKISKFDFRCRRRTDPFYGTLRDRFVSCSKIRPGIRMSAQVAASHMWGMVSHARYEMSTVKAITWYNTWGYLQSLLMSLN